MRYFLIMVITFGLLPIPLIETRSCYFCDITNIGNCPGARITCTEEDECYIGRGATLGLPTVTIKGCVEASRCGQEQQITYMGTTLSVIIYCCHTELCNVGLQIPNETLIYVAADAATKLSAKTFLMVLPLFLL